MARKSCMIIMICFSILLFKLNINATKGVVNYVITSYIKCLSSQYDTLYSVSTVSAMQCAEECAGLDDCLAVNYRRRFKLCQLFSKSNGLVSIKSETKGECVFIEKGDIYVGKTKDDTDNCDETSDKAQNYGTHFCPKLELQNGTVFGNRNSIGSRVEYTCNKYLAEPAGQKYSICQQNGTWSHLPICLKYFEYMGCYIDKRKRLLDGPVIRSETMTTQYCVNSCFDMKYTYALTESKKECFCGDIPRDYEKRDEHECNTPCSGDASEMCGGRWRASLYKRMNI